MVLLIVLAALLCWATMGCSVAARRQIRDTGQKALPAAAVLVVFFPFGVLVDGCATVGTIIITDLFTTSVSFETGETVGEDAWKKQATFWKSNSALLVKDVEDAKTGISLASHAKDWAKMLAYWIVAAFVTIALIRNRQWIPVLLSAQSKGYRLSIVWHMLFGGMMPVIPPQFIKDVAVLPKK